MYRHELPRVYELRDLITDSTSPDAYFSNFDASLQQHPEKKSIWLNREREFQRLDPESWSFLKEEARPYLINRDTNGRDWEQLVAVLNQTRGYIYLANIGCSKVCFIPRANRKNAQTPDVEGYIDDRKVLCEVKTISASDTEIIKRQNGEVRSVVASLNRGFFKKLGSTLDSANKQLVDYDDSPKIRRVALLVLNFDDSFAEYKSAYYSQIDRWLSNQLPLGLELVFYNQLSPLHVSITMQNGIVVNEAGQPEVQ